MQKKKTKLDGAEIFILRIKGVSQLFTWHIEHSEAGYVKKNNHIIHRQNRSVWRQSGEQSHLPGTAT